MLGLIDAPELRPGERGLVEPRALDPHRAVRGPERLGHLARHVAPEDRHEQGGGPHLRPRERRERGEERVEHRDVDRTPVGGHAAVPDPVRRAEGVPVVVELLDVALAAVDPGLVAELDDLAEAHELLGAGLRDPEAERLEGVHPPARRGDEVDPPHRAVAGRVHGEPVRIGAPHETTHGVADEVHPVPAGRALHALDAAIDPGGVAHGEVAHVEPVEPRDGARADRAVREALGVGRVPRVRGALAVVAARDDGVRGQAVRGESVRLGRVERPHDRAPRREPVEERREVVGVARDPVNQDHGDRPVIGRGRRRRRARPMTGRSPWS